MKKLYTELQYREYSKLCERMVNIDDILEGAKIHFEINEFLINNNIIQQAQEQMDARMEQEDIDEMNGVKKEGKVIDFPNWVERGETPVCADCIHKIVLDGHVGCEHPYLYTKDGNLIESRNNTISNNIAKNRCSRKETK